MRFQVGNIVRISKKASNYLDESDEAWRNDGINGEIVSIDESSDFAYTVEFEEENYDEELTNIFAEETLRLVRR